MYQKVLVPLDESKESEKVLGSVPDMVSPGGEVILLKVIPPMGSQTIGQLTLTGGEREDAERGRVIDYLRGAARGLVGESVRRRCEVVVSKSIAEGIATFAAREGVDLIAMYTHDRKGLARLVRGSIATKVQHSSPVEVRLFRPREVAEVGP